MKADAELEKWRRVDKEATALIKGLLLHHVPAFISYMLLLFVFLWIFDKYGFERMVATCFVALILSLNGLKKGLGVNKKDG